MKINPVKRASPSCWLTLLTSSNTEISGCRWWDSNSQPLDYKPSVLAIDLYSSKAIARKELNLSSWCIASVYIYHFSTVIDFSSEKYSGSTGHRNSEKFTVRMPMVRLELATPGLQTQCSSHWAIQLESCCWEGVEFIQLVYCIIIYLSFLNCDWLLIREVQWFYWTQELLVPVEKFTVRMRWLRITVEKW